MILFIRGYKVLIDDADYELVKTKKWTVMPSGKTKYCRLTTGSCDMMHRVIMGLKPKEQVYVDHRDGNGLNNQRKNLRLATPLENARNLHNVSGDVPYPGVYRDKKKFRAQIRVGKRRISLGSFKTAAAAAAIYRRACLHYFGEYASSTVTTVKEKNEKSYFIERK